MKVTYCTLSDMGDRKNNEDRVVAQKRHNDFCFGLADGLGGHEKGEVASTIVTNTAVMAFLKEGFTEFYLREVLEKAQENLMKEQ